ncbi:hypothetical protein GGI18_004957, partial [Coemansia linderi]
PRVECSPHANAHLRSRQRQHPSRGKGRRWRLMQPRRYAVLGCRLQRVCWRSLEPVVQLWQRHHLQECWQRHLLRLCL